MGEREREPRGSGRTDAVETVRDGDAAGGIDPEQPAGRKQPRRVRTPGETTVPSDHDGEPVRESEGGDPAGGTRPVITCHETHPHPAVVESRDEVDESVASMRG